MSTNGTPMENRIYSFIKEKKIDGILLRKCSNFSWITQGKDNHIVLNTELGVADLVIFPDKKYCITSKMEAARIQEEELRGLGYEFITPEWYEGHESSIIELCKGKVIGSDVPFEHFVHFGEQLSRLRYSLSDEEMNRYYWLSQKTAQAVETTCHEIEPGWTEHEINAHLAAKMLKEGIKPVVLLVATDERIFHFRHPIPTDKKLEKYAMLVICAEKWGLVSNCTRLVHFGVLPEEICGNKVKLAQIDVAMNASTRPGAAIKDIFQVGIDMYKKVGYPDDWRLLHQGGPTGYAPREFLAVPDVPGVVQVNQAFAWNPSIRGVTSEDTILVKETGNEFITHTGEWVYIDVEYNGQKYLRPDILVR